MRKVPEEKLLLKSELMRAGEREFQTNMAWKTPTKLVNTKIYVPVNFKTAHSPPPGQSPSIWLAFSSIQWGIWPKMRPPGGAFDFCVKSSVSGQKQKDFEIFWFSTWAAFTGHCSCWFHVGFSVVVVLYSYIVEYGFVLSVEWRQAEQKIRRLVGSTVALTCLEGEGFGPLGSTNGWGIWPSNLETQRGIWPQVRKGGPDCTWRAFV